MALRFGLEGGGARPVGTAMDILARAGTYLLFGLPGAAVSNRGIDRPPWYFAGAELSAATGRTGKDAASRWEDCGNGMAAGSAPARLTLAAGWCRPLSLPRLACIRW